MAHTYFAVHLHLVFSTKNRTPWLTREVRESVFPYLATAIRDHATTARIVGGHNDHIHALISPESQVLIPDLVKEIKRTSSAWLKTKWEGCADFAWQDGYGAFSVSQSNLPRVRKYIETQESHHQKITFADEYRALLVRHRIPFDERFYLG